jgi:hypothetical protein
MKLIFYHFLHLYFLTLFEVIFYIKYVMPYEKKIIFDLFDDLDIKSILPVSVNKSDSNPYTDLIYNKKQCTSYQDKLDNSNAKLLDNCLGYIITINILLFLLFVFDIYQNYNCFCSISINVSPKNIKYTPTYNSNSSLIAFKSSQNIQNDYKKNDNKDFELVNISNNGTFIPNDKSNEKSNMKPNEYFIVYYYKNSQIVKEILKLIQFIILVGIFEYLFFTLVVNKYKIANIHTILCNIVKKLIN